MALVVGLVIVAARLAITAQVDRAVLWAPCTRALVGPLPDRLAHQPLAREDRLAR
jgi:hypothetical protein